MGSLQRVVVVYGATGTQGRAVALSLLKSRQNFTVRALTRNPESENAQELAKLGAEVVKADGFNDDSMKAALTGAWGFWLNTHHHDPSVTTPGGPTDEDLGRRLVTIAAQAGVKVFIYSTCESPDKFTNGKAPVPGMDAKHRVELFAREFKEFDSVIGAFPGWYFENLITPIYAQSFGGFPLYPDAEGFLTFTSPLVGGEGKVQTVSIADDFGEMVHGMFLNPEKWKNQTIQCLSEAFTYEDMVKTFTEGKLCNIPSICLTFETLQNMLIIYIVTGKKARYVPMASYMDFPTHDNTVLIELRDVFRYTQHNNGQFFGNADNVITCQHLKDEARRDKGLPQEPVISMRDYLINHYGNKV
ncbi:hypothetical protein N7499_008074 [Penicillium canescens]|uniref:NmrA-like domain-containing protein n=1 Tax=Penicillium canescens TaxID=5083 RepID=A0AAD6HZE9_PENCN|nr:uncharacterized protein N7446_013109 [Penicillium canescens]KAJ6022757.1 hypothetical protein N7460_013152 [Penicillium canescens]KAJ6025979.1 hypothetical protein N7444_013658 [Penicillium canescens]KAJ6042043.1 hypothetical protein N7446_013109 [Penicillium canescens]KAJ6076093.1 hypothetical protein N7499_008074 [Penicillium canescens]KAJ6158405.1 hypothetical protein N7485_011231 [Penicillium canescens]